MRKTTFLWLLLAVICGCLLFRTSQQVTDGRVKLAAIEAETRKEEESIRVLDAEWSYLNQPDRLEKLSKQYLDLVPLKGRQFSKIADLGGKAPAAPASPAMAAAAGVAPVMADAEDDDADDTSVDDGDGAVAATSAPPDVKPAETKTADTKTAASDKPAKTAESKTEAKTETKAAPDVKSNVVAKYAGLKIDKDSAETVTPLSKTKAKPASAPAAHTAAKAPLRNYVYSPPAKAAPSPYAVYAASRAAGNAGVNHASPPPPARDFGEVLKSIGGN